MKAFFDDNFITIFGFNLPFLYVFIFFVSLMGLSLLIFALSFLLKKNKTDQNQNKREIQINKIDEEINSIVKQYRSKESSHLPDKEDV